MEKGGKAEDQPRLSFFQIPQMDSLPNPRGESCPPNHPRETFSQVRRASNLKDGRREREMNGKKVLFFSLFIRKGTT
jgi:hypothetical protein